MLKSYKTLSLLLSYPTPELHHFLPEAVEVLTREKLLPPEKFGEVSLFTKWAQALEILEWQVQYVALFDHSRATSLHIFEHLKGDSKERGQAMVDLISLYREKGWEMTTRELPDFLPLFLEFLATLEIEEAALLLADIVEVIQKIHLTLRKKEQPYHHLFSALTSLSARQPAEKPETTPGEVTNPEKAKTANYSGSQSGPVSGNMNPCQNCK